MRQLGRGVFFVVQIALELLEELSHTVKQYRCQLITPFDSTSAQTQLEPGQDGSHLGCTPALTTPHRASASSLIRPDRAVPFLDCTAEQGAAGRYVSRLHDKGE